MNPATGRLEEDKVEVINPKDIGRLYTKSNFGKTTSNNTLHLSLIEAAYLIDEQKLIINEDEKRIDFQHIISHAAINDSSFETKYIIFQNLRNRGQQIRLCDEGNDFTFTLLKKNEGDIEKQCLIYACSERNKPDLLQIHHLIEHADQHQADAWIAIADEEGDVTYYIIEKNDLKGQTTTYRYPKTTAISLQDRVLLFNQNIAKKLHQQEFFGKPFGKGLQLSFVEAVHLMQRKILTITDPVTQKTISEKKLKQLFLAHQPDISLRAAVFNDLKQRGMLVKTGFKFGTHFRGYTQMPDKSHAEYLIHVITPAFQSSWAEISRAIRLAHSVNKTFIFALFFPNKEIISYLSFCRLRP